jgi:hypothetical protein
MQRFLMLMHVKSVIILALSAILVGGIVFTTFYKAFNVTPSSSSSLDANYVYSKSSSSIPLLTAAANTTTSPSIPGNFNFASGRIVSVQENDTRHPMWIAEGIWNLTRTKSTPNIQLNSTAIIFVAKFNTINLDGSLKERYRISNFKITNAAATNVADTFNGTVSVHGSADYTNLPISIKIVGKGQDGTIIIWLDPEQVDNHFGNGPIYGLVRTIA